MTKHQLINTSLLGTLLLLPLHAVQAAPGGKGNAGSCTPITALPATISAPGVYCLRDNLATAQTTGNAISISASDVVLDLSGRTLDGSSAGSGTEANGIYSSASAAKVTVLNGTVQGFLRGILLAGVASTVHGVNAYKNTWLGIQVSGSGCLIQDNQVVDTGGTTASGFGKVAGISTGDECLVENNLVSDFVGGMGDGILIGSRTAARGNTVTESGQLPYSFITRGITSQGEKGAAINNVVTNFQYGVYFYYSGTYSRNMAISCQVPYYGGTAGSGND